MRIIRRLLAYGILIGVWLFTMLPIWEIVKTSINPTRSLISTTPQLLPIGISFDSYRELITETYFLQWILNSTIVALATTIGVVGLASLTGYALSRFRFMGRTALVGLIFSTQVFPLTMMLLPLYLLITYFNLFDQVLTLVFLYVVMVLPFCIWQMKGYYDAIPPHLEMSALVDGCTRFQAFYRVVFPMALPALAVTALFAFIGAWGEYIIASIIIESPDRYTLSLGLREFSQTMSTDWGKYAAASLLVSVPVCFFFIAVNRWLIESLNLSGVKA